MKTYPPMAAAVALALISVCANPPARAAEPESADRAAIVKTAEAFVEAFQKGDAKAVAAFWTPDGDYVDLSGRTLKGRNAIEEEYEHFFAENKGLKARIEVASIQFPTPDSAVEDGVSSVITPDGSPPSRARYTNVLVKKDGKWLLSSVRESPYEPPNNSEHLSALQWTIGEWVDVATEGHKGHLIFEFTPDENFIISTRAVEVKGEMLDNGSQRIGWDPAAKVIRSWSFEPDGGFGESIWQHDGDKWVIKTTSVLRSGSIMTTTNIVTRVDADTIVWQSTDQQLDGKAQPDGQTVKMKRVKDSDATP